MARAARSRSRQPGQGQPAKVLRRPEIGGRGLVQLGQPSVHVLAQPGLEEPGQRERKRLARLGVGQLGEVTASLAVRAGGRKPGGEGDRGAGRRRASGPLS